MDEKHCQQQQPTSHFGICTSFCLSATDNSGIHSSLKMYSFSGCGLKSSSIRSGSKKWRLSLSYVYIVLLILAISTQQTTSLLSSSRQLQEVNGVEACKGCRGNSKCVGRTVSDTSCNACATGQTFWPCNLKQECWCWDTSGPRVPPGDEDKTTACSGCGRDSTTEVCVGNQNSLTPVSDDECSNCMSGQSYWPCSDQDLCWCWDTTKPKKPPAPISGYPANESVDPCSLFTKDMFDVFAPNSTFPYTYDGLCDAIRDYNKDHTEKVFQMGTEDLIRKEIAAFLGNTAHESDDFEAGREYLACGDRKEVDGKVYCKPCTNDLYDWKNNECSVSMVDQNAPYNSYCQPGFEPPEGCVCDTITQVEETGPLAGYVEASKVFYGRGAIQLSWNYNYIRASFALTGEADTFCSDPEQVVLNPNYAWGTAIFFWMESQKEGTTCHKEALNRDFGGTLNVINGGLECPAYKGGWHHDAIKMRINRYCHAAVLLGIEKLSSFGGCKGLTDSFEECLGDGWCPHCEQYAEIPTEESGFTSVEIEDNGSTEEDTDTAEEDAKTSVPTADPTSSNPEPSPPPTILFSKTKSPTMSPSTKTSSLDTGTPTTLKPSFSSNIETGTPTSATPTLKPSTRPTDDPSSSPVTTSPTLAPTEPQPTYMPTTPQPTMGPCSGEACPDGQCRSAWGFCGNAEGYCNDSSIWSPTCPPSVTAPSPPSPQMTSVPAPPTKSPIGTSSLNDVFGVSDETDAGEDLTLPPTGQPTIPISSGPKPTGGKPGGKPKPAINSPTTLEPSNSPTPLPTSLPTPASPPTQNPSKGSESYEDFANLSYPENTFFCGRTWEQVNNSCSLRCPSSKSEDCPEGLSCFAFTQCNDKVAEDATTDSMDSQSDGSGESTTSDVESDGSGEAIATDVTSVPEEETSLQEGCTGTPCPFENECRSEYGFCGTSFIYCNMLSSWTLEKCGLLGIDANGETQLCDVEVFECATGEAVHRNPAEGCEYFPCPSVEEEGAVLSSAFSVPAPSPFPPLPKPTLPTIIKPSASHSSSAFLPTSSTSTSESDSSNSLAILLGDNNVDEVVDDTDKQEEDDVEEEESESTTDATTKPISASYDFGSFKADEWLFTNSVHNRYDWTCQLLVSLFTVVLLFI